MHAGEFREAPTGKDPAQQLAVAFAPHCPAQFLRLGATRGVHIGPFAPLAAGFGHGAPRARADPKLPGPLGHSAPPDPQEKGDQLLLALHGDSPSLDRCIKPPRDRGE